ncbi:MAG TPA: extracellular solute-binding protein [Nocardioidaceae bacterium]|nr:extracellular solute-binding protein [Nocardioidaceae bacterium]
MGTTRKVWVSILAVLLLAVAGCGSGTGGPGTAGGSGSAKSFTLYTCVSDTTINPVIKAFEKAHPGMQVKLYRAPTGDLNARIAGDIRSGGLRADAIWACDPLTMQDYVGQGLIGDWTPATDIPEEYRTDHYVGVALLYMVAVTHEGVAPPASWKDLTDARYDGSVAVPDPNIAASALGALGYFAADPSYGLDFYATLKKNGGTQLSTPTDVVNGVAQGTYKAGITIANSAYAAKQSGSPIAVTWPDPGSVAIYGPIALAKHSADNKAAKSFCSYVTSKQGQTVIADSGSYPTLAGVPGPTEPADAKIVSPDWMKLSHSKDKVLRQYQSIFGGR